VSPAAHRLARPAALLAALALASGGCTRSEQDWQARLGARDPFERRLAVAGLAARGDLSALPSLIAALDDPEAEVARAAAAALAHIGEPAVAPLLEGLLADTPIAVRERSLRALAALGAPALPALIAAVREGPPVWEQQAITAALGRLGRSAAEPLAALLDDPDEHCAARAARALAVCGPQAAAALPALARALRAPQPALRLEAALAVRAIDPTHEGALLAAITGARDPDPAAREAILLAGVSGLLVRMRDSDGLRAHAAQQQIESLGRAALPALAAALREVSDGVTFAGDRGGALDPATEAAATCLAALGPEALPALFAALNPGHPLHVERAGRVVARLGAPAQEVLIGIARDEHHPRRLLGIALLTAAGELPEELSGYLFSLLRSSDPTLRVAAAWAIARHPPAEDATLARLIDEADRQDAMTRRTLLAPIVQALVARIATRPDEAALWRARLDALGAESWATLQTLRDGSDPIAAAIAGQAMAALPRQPR